MAIMNFLNLLAFGQKLRYFTDQNGAKVGNEFWVFSNAGMNITNSWIVKSRWKVWSYLSSSQVSFLSYQGIHQEGQKFCVLHELENKMHLRSRHTVSPSVGSGRPGGKSLEKSTTFSLRLVWYTLLKIIKLNLSVSNKKLLLWYKVCSYVCFRFFIGQEESKGKLCKIIILNL